MTIGHWIVVLSIIVALGFVLAWISTEPPNRRNRS
jgi:hypothetical protein